MSHEPSGSAAPQVFVSKASEDSVAAMRAVALLGRAGLRAWISEHDIPDGGYHAAEVPRAIRHSQGLMVLLSLEAVASEWVIREVDVAVTAGVPVFPVALPGFGGAEGLPDEWQFLLTRAQIRADGDLEAVVASIRDRLLGGGAGAPPAPPSVRSPSQPGPAHPDDGTGTPTRVASPTARAFVGEERQEVLAALQADWRQVVVERSARVVVLLAETGFGKTRIVQELYRRLAAAQPTPGFWPADIVEIAARGHRALRESRKRVAPLDLMPPEGSQAGYLWLGHAVDEGHGGRVDVGLQHLGEDLARALSLAAAAQPEGPAARMVAHALGGAPEPGTDTRVALAELLHRGAPVGGQEVASGTVEAFWQGVRALWGAVADPIPTIIVVEDGHFGGQETTAALEQLATSKGLPFLVVVCAQESQLRDAVGQPAAAPDGLRRPLGRLIDQRLPALTVTRLNRLPDADVAALIRESIPDLDPRTLGAAVHKVDGNPYHAHTLLVEMVRAAAQGRLNVAWVQSRPSTFEGELRQQWAMLPDDVRRLLSGMALLGSQIPERIGMHAMRSVYGCDPGPDVEASLGSGWLRRLASDELLRFLERPRWLIANAESYEEWPPAQRRQIIEDALGTLESLAEDSGGQVDPLLQGLHLALARTADRDGIPFDRVAAVRAGLAGSLRLRLANDDPGCLSVAQETEQLVLGHETEPGMAALAVESAWMVEEGLESTLPDDQLASGLVAPAELVVTRAHRVAHRRPELVALAYAALSRAHRVRLDPQRLALSRSALDEAESWLARAPTSDLRSVSEVLRARGQLTKALGDNRLSAEVSERRLDILQRAWGPLDRRVLGALMTTAFYWSRVDIERSLTLRQDLLARRLRVWGDRSSPFVAIAEKELAVSLARHPEQNWLAEAHELSTHALESLVRARGEHHRSTVRARSVMSFTACRLSDDLELAGDDASAHRLREGALIATTDTLAHTGSTARPMSVLIRRHRQAACMIRLGDAQGLITLGELLEQSQATDWADRDSGLHDIEVLWTVAELVAGLCRLDREDEAWALVAQHPIEREERWPAFQPRGWRSTRPQDARAGVL